MRIRDVGWLMLVAAAPAWAGAEDYRFDTVHTQITFFVDHLGFSKPSGRLHVKNGFIHFDQDDWSQAKVDATIDIASLDMGDAAWEKRLRDNDFFDVKRFATARFVSERVDKTGDNRGVAHGRLTLHGVTKPCDIEFAFNRADFDRFSLHRVAGFSATATLKRSDFGMRTFKGTIGDDVEIRIEVEASRDRHAGEKVDPDDARPPENPPSEDKS